ncbi:hypothetical protein [Myxococcus sp. RHSTA-1-4]|uniref:hypothetical protein n=1 Tax=Myxococcus sp. RHSTA-1-4 TaxID=2874601 RepID=UPI001CBC975D|nr:hypothetical protein [Myxococcus sp. RHSTA-1-4]MBZ4416566.1 hypothetical protein [Myxococcus sp. RHSTA-1-4]
MTSKRVVLLVAILGSFPSVAQQATYAIPDGINVQLGMGFDSLGGRTRATCVETASDTQTGTLTRFELHAVESFRDLRRELGVSASMSFGIGLWSGGAYASYSSSRNFSNRTSFLLVRAIAQNGANFVKEPYKLNEWAAKLEPADFLDKCGDSFISSRVLGGEFLAVYKFESESEENAEQVRAGIRAAAGNFSGAADVERKLNEIRGYSSLEVRIIRKGSSETLPSAQDTKKLLEYALNLPELVKPGSGNEYPYSFATTPYQLVQGFRRTSSISSRQRALNALAEAADEAWLRLARVNQIINNSNKYAFESKKAELEELRKIRDRLRKLTAEYTEMADKCIESPDASCAAAVADDLPEVPNILPLSARGGCTKWGADGTVCRECEYTADQADPRGIAMPHAGSIGFDVRCRNMAQGKKVNIKASGKITRTPASEATWMEIDLHSTTSPCPNSGGCKVGFGSSPGVEGINLNNSVTVPPSGTVDAYLMCRFCQLANASKCSIVPQGDFKISFKED